MQISPTLHWVDLALAALGFAFVLTGVIQLLRRDKDNPKALGTALISVLLGAALVVQALSDKLQNAAGEPVAAHWGQLIVTGLYVAAIILMWRIRPDPANEAARQLTRDLQRLYGKSPEDSR